MSEATPSGESGLPGDEEEWRYFSGADRSGESAACPHGFPDGGGDCCRVEPADEFEHRRASTPHGPDYCEPCSEAAQEWVAWEGHIENAQTTAKPRKRDLPPLMEPYDDSGQEAANDLLTEVERLRKELDGTKRVLFNVVASYQDWRPHDLPNELVDSAVFVGEKHLRYVGHWPPDRAGWLRPEAPLTDRSVR